MGRHGGHWGQPWGGPWAGHPRGHAGPPPWLAGLFGMPQQSPGPARRGPRVRRGDVRAAILDVLDRAGREGEPVNGYQVIQRIGERSGDEWRPSPGSVYPTIQQLQDEGLVESDDERGRRTVRLTAAGRTYVEEHAAELAAVWAPFDRSEEEAGSGDLGDVKSEIGQVMSAVWQILTSGSDRQRGAAMEILVDTRRRLYGVLADGHDQEEE